MIINLKYRYANTPYLNNGTRLYTNTGLTTYKSEYYCDGIYFYDHLTGSIISNKEVSYTLKGLINNLIDIFYILINVDKYKRLAVLLKKVFFKDL